MATIGEEQTASTQRAAGTAQTARSKGRRPAVVALLIAVIAAVVALTVYAVTRPVKVWDRDTPQGVVQAYVTAVVAGDTVAAAALFASDSPCGATDLDRAFVPTGTLVDLVGADVQGTQARVRVLVEVDAGAQPFVGGEERTFRLTRTGTGWRIDGIPWPLYECTGG